MEVKKTEKKNIPYYIIPIIIVLALIPLVAIKITVDANLSEMPWFVEHDQYTDVYNYCKSRLLPVVAVAMLVMTIVALVQKKKLSLHVAMLPLAGYAVLVVVSTVQSEFQWFSLHGMVGTFETTFVLLAYCVFVLFSYWFVDSEQKLRYVLYAWLGGIGLMGLVGIFQLLGGNVVFMTLHNPNYVGFYAVLTIPVLTTLYIFSENKDFRTVCIVLNSVVFLCLMGSGARNGMIALFVSLLVMLVMLRKKLKEYKDNFIVAYGSMLIIFAVFNLLNGGLVTERLESGLTVEENASGGLEDIATNDDNVVITYGGNDLIVTMNETADDILLEDQNGASVEKTLVAEEEGLLFYEFADERFPFTAVVAELNEIPAFSIEIDGKLVSFSNQTGEPGYFYYTNYERFVKIIKAESAVFTNYGNLASGRGYIWARTIPLLEKYLWVGSGPDTFMRIFPQQDYGAAAVFGFESQTISKPHNIYLQIGTQTGILSLAAYLLFNLIYLIECVILYMRKTANHFLEYMGVAVMIAIIGYLISGIINDSSVTVSPIYWCLMGIGLAVNRMVKKTRVAKAE